jgi:predicted dithiol-disulfide oxidoreductase (DUF899 family)
MEPDMSYRDTSAALEEHRQQIGDIRRRMREIQATVEPEPVRDYELATTQGPIRLSELFGGHAELALIHNMGASCPYCTLWADGFNGIYHHLANRLAFVVCTPDPPEVQTRFAAGRGWRFPMVSHHGTEFATAMGYRSENGRWLPGVSVFRRDGDRILRVADTGFHPEDDFCSLWHLLDLLPEGPAGWEPRFRYD